MMTKKLTQSPTQVLKARVKAARAELSILGKKRAEWEFWLFSKYPEYKNVESYKRIQNVWFGYAADIDLTAHIEEFVQENQPE